MGSGWPKPKPAPLLLVYQTWSKVILVDEQPEAEDGHADHDAAADGDEQGLVDSSEVHGGTHSSDEADGEEDAKGAENEVNEE